MVTNSFYKLSYGLYLVTSKSGDKFNGYIANTAFQVTAEPPQIAISCHIDNLTTKFINESGVFAISVLEQDTEMDLLQKFSYSSGNDVDKFENTEYYRDVKKAFAPRNAPTFVEGGFVEGDPRNNGVPRIARDDKDVGNEGGTDINGVPTSGGDPEHLCIICGYTYNPEEGDPGNGIAPGTPFDELPDDWVCPVCRAGKEYFKAM